MESQKELLENNQKELVEVYPQENPVGTTRNSFSKNWWNNSWKESRKNLRRRSWRKSRICQNFWQNPRRSSQMNTWDLPGKSRKKFLKQSWKRFLEESWEEFLVLGIPSVSRKIKLLKTFQKILKGESQMEFLENSRNSQRTPDRNPMRSQKESWKEFLKESQMEHFKNLKGSQMELLEEYQRNRRCSSLKNDRRKS